MLVLVAGATGNVGQPLVLALLSRGHQVRILARSPSKMAEGTLARLEGVVRPSAYWDVGALDRACAGVDGVICAYNGQPELTLDAQLLLLRAAERAGVRRFIASSWNYDWRDMPLGVQPSYDPIIAFRNHVDKSSDIRPVYIFSGVLAEVLFSVDGHGDFSPRNHGVWDPVAKSMDIWGSGDELWHWTTEKDAAEFAADIISRDDAPQGGFWSVCSGSGSLKDVAATYEKVRGTKVQMNHRGTVEELRTRALAARSKGSVRNFWPYIGYFYTLHTVDGTWVLKDLDNGKLDVKTTTLEEFLIQNPAI
jgi:nucleoside-diphosphate-sugar epimerase